MKSEVAKKFLKISENTKLSGTVPLSIAVRAVELAESEFDWKVNLKYNKPNTDTILVIRGKKNRSSKGRSKLFLGYKENNGDFHELETDSIIEVVYGWIELPKEEEAVMD